MGRTNPYSLEIPVLRLFSLCGNVSEVIAEVSAVFVDTRANDVVIELTLEYGASWLG